MYYYVYMAYLIEDTLNKWLAHPKSMGFGHADHRSINICISASFAAFAAKSHIFVWYHNLIEDRTRLAVS